MKRIKAAIRTRWHQLPDPAQWAIGAVLVPAVFALTPVILLCWILAMLAAATVDLIDKVLE